MKISVNKPVATLQALDAVQFGCTEHVLGPYDLIKSCAQFEAQLDGINVPATARIGCELIVAPGSGMKYGKKNAPLATFAHLDRGAKFWYLVRLERAFADTTSSAEGLSSKAALSEAAKKAALNFLEGWKSTKIPAQCR